MNFTEIQHRAIHDEAREILVIAGAGSGKTRVMVERVARIIADGIEPRSVVVITFTNNAADELKQRLNKMRSGLGDALGFCGTVHGFLLRLIRENYSIVGAAESIAVFDEETRNELIHDAIERLSFGGTETDVLRALKVGVFENRKIKTPSKAEIVARYYFNRMIEAGALDFDSILIYGLELLRRLNGDVILNGQTVTHLFVDEVQDSSNEEFAFYREAKIQNKFYVGDPDQAIYSFRGGNVENILALANTPGVLKILMEENFRCARTVCDGAQALIEHNKNRFAKRTVATTTEPGELLLNVDAPGGFSEAHWIAKDILKNLCATVDATRPERSVAVLARTRYIVSEIAKILEGAGIMIARKEIERRPADWRAAVNAINFLANPDNDTFAFKLIEHVHGRQEAERVKQRANAAFSSIQGLEGLIDSYDMSLDLVTTFLARRARISVESRERVNMIIDQLPPHSTLNELALAVARDEQARATYTDGVTVTTIHAAKGREWDVVYLPAWEQGVMPAGQNPNTEEERRLGYVGITRARERCVVTCAQKRKPEYGPPFEIPATRSQFVAEIAG